MHSPPDMGLSPAALALVRWQEHLKGQVRPKALHLTGQVRPKALHLKGQVRPKALPLKGQVQLKALERSQQEVQPGAGALQARGLFAPVSS